MQSLNKNLLYYVYVLKTYTRDPFATLENKTLTIDRICYNNALGDTKFNILLDAFIAANKKPQVTLLHMKIIAVYKQFYNPDYTLLYNPE